MLTSCELCTRPMWHMFKPPPALGCKRKLLEMCCKNRLLTWRLFSPHQVAVSRFIANTWSVVRRENRCARLQKSPLARCTTTRIPQKSCCCSLRRWRNNNSGLHISRNAYKRVAIWQYKILLLCAIRQALSAREVNIAHSSCYRLSASI